MLRMYRDSFILIHDAPGTTIGRPWVLKVYIDYRKAKSMFYMMETFLWNLLFYQNWRTGILEE